MHVRGRYQGMYTMSWSIAALVAPLMSGFVIDRFGAEWLWALCAVVGTVAGRGYGVLTQRVPEEDGSTKQPEARPSEPTSEQAA